MKKILFAASECVPFIKTGGLADVCGALPKEFDKKSGMCGWLFRIIAVFRKNTAASLSM